MKFRSAILVFVFAQGFLFSACVADVQPWCDLSRKHSADTRNLMTLAADGSKSCVVRDWPWSKDEFHVITGYLCCYYTNRILFSTSTTLCIALCYGYPCFWESEDYDCSNSANQSKETFFFDYTNEKAVSILREKGFKKGTKGFDNWIQCSEAAMNCCENMKEEDIRPADGHCTANWDGWTCLDRSPVNKTQHKPCPAYIYSGESPSCQHYSNKSCYNSTWETTSYDYITCSLSRMLQDRIIYHVILLSISIAISIPALVIFFGYRSLRKTRVILHRNLITAIVIRNIFSIVVKTVINLDALSDSGDGTNVMTENSAWCRMFSFMDKLANSAVFSCLLLEGIFLHRLIAAAFKQPPKMLYYYIGASGLAVVPLAVWTIVTVIHNDVYCWTVDKSDYIYIIDGPRIFTLAVNFLLMMDIVRVLCTKLRSVNSFKSNQTRRTARATIMLIPLFGVQFLVTLARPETDDCVLEQIYYYFFYTMDGLQGTLVALLYCYLNKEVHGQLQRTYDRLQIRFHQLIGKEYRQRQRPTFAYSEHPPTATTFVGEDDVSMKGAPFHSGNKHGRSDRALVIGSASDSG